MAMKEYELKIFLCNGEFVIEKLDGDMFKSTIMKKCLPIVEKWLDDNHPLWRRAILVADRIDFMGRKYKIRTELRR